MKEFLEENEILVFLFEILILIFIAPIFLGIFFTWLAVCFRFFRYITRMIFG